MRATEFITEALIPLRNLFGKGTKPIATLAINPHTVERQNRPNYRPIRDDEIERVMQKIVRNKEIIMKTIAPRQVCSVFDPEMNIGMMIQRRRPEKPGGLDQLIVVTVTPARMWGKEHERVEIDLR